MKNNTTKSDYDILEICRLVYRSDWKLVANPTMTWLDWGAQALADPFTDYVEYASNDLVSRFIRRKDLHKYM